MNHFHKSSTTELKEYPVTLTGIISVNGIYAYSDSVNGFKPVNGSFSEPLLYQRQTVNGW